MQITIFYEKWQMDCCGDPFSVDELVEWSCCKMNMALFGADYIYEAHLPSDCFIKGKVVKIHGITSTFQQPNNAHHAVSCSTKPLQTADRFMAKAETGFLVTLTDVEIAA